MQNSDPTRNLLPLESVERLLVRLDRLSGQDSEQPVFQVFVDGIADTLGDSAAVWKLSRDGQPRLLHRHDDHPSELPETQPVWLLGGGAGTIAVDEVTDRVLVSCEFSPNELFVVDLIASKLTPDVSGQREEILHGLAEIGGKLLLQQQYRDVSDRLQSAQLTEPILDLVCKAQPLDESCRTLASIVRKFTGADRVSVCQSHAGGTRLLAMDPAKNINRRAEQVRLLERFAHDVASREKGYSYVIGGDSGDILPSLSEYTDVAESRQVFASCCGEGVTAIKGVIVVESHEVSGDLERRFSSVADQSIRAFEELLAREDRGAMGFLHRLKTSSAVRKAGLFFGMTILAIAMLFLIPAELRIPANGYLHPIESRSVFAPSDGIVEEIHVSHNQRVSRGDRLLSIRDPDLELRRSQLGGEIATLEAQLASLRAVKSQVNRDRSQRSADNARLTADEEDLKIQIDGLNAQLGLVNDYLQELVVETPIGGVADCFEIRRNLQGRPISHGQHLLDVVNDEAGWELRIEIDDDLSGYVSSHQQSGKCQVDFRIRSNPTQSYSSNIEWLARATQLDSRGYAFVLATSDLSDSALESPRSGAAVIAEIHCGRRSLGFVWFREIIEYLQKSFLI